MKKLLPVIMLCFALSAACQSDVLVLKRRDQIVQTWIRGSFIGFQFFNKQWIQGRIRELREDSVLLDVMVINQMPGKYGTIVTDTGRVGLLRMHVKEIYALPKRNSGTGIISNGALFKLGGGGYIFLNIFNSLIKNEQVFSARNVTGLGIAGAVLATGFILSATHKDYIRLGKKYHVALLHSAP